MLDVMNDMICLAVCERCIVRVGGELSFTSDDSSVARVRFKVADVRKVLDEGVCLLFG